MTEPEFHESHAAIGDGRGRSAERLVIVGLVVLLLLVVKPWGATPVVPETATAPGTLASAPPTPGVPDFADPPCTGRSWLVEADTRWADQTVRSWTLTEAVQATGPTDPDIRFAVAAAQEVLAIGYCPSDRDDRRPQDSVTIYRLDPTLDPIGVTISPVNVAPVRHALDAQGATNELFAPLATPGPGAQVERQVSWSPGRYVMRIEGPDGYLRWLGIEIRIIGVGEASPRPSAAR